MMIIDLSTLVIKYEREVIGDHKDTSQSINVTIESNEIKYLTGSMVIIASKNY